MLSSNNFSAAIESQVSRSGSIDALLVQSLYNHTTVNQYCSAMKVGESTVSKNNTTVSVSRPTTFPQPVQVSGNTFVADAATTVIIIPDSNPLVVPHFLAFEGGLLKDYNSNYSLVMTVNTNLGPSSSQFQMPLWPDGEYNFYIEWGDNTFDHITTYDDPAVTHIYASSGTYTIRCYGLINGFGVRDTSLYTDFSKLAVISEWNELFSLGTNATNAFLDCYQLLFTAPKPFNLANTTNLTKAFSYAHNGNPVSAPLWDTSQVTTMESMFFLTFAFNQNISAWDVSKVQNFNFFLVGANTFNHPLNDWDVSSAVNMQLMFGFLPLFNQPLNNWNVSNVNNMSGMFYGCSVFHQDLNNWNVSKVANMSNMFENATQFNGDITTWDVSNVRSFSYMFDGASHFNRNLSGWDVSSLLTANSMFKNAVLFKQNLAAWSPFQCEDMTDMFFNVDMNSPSSAVNQNNYNALLLSWGTEPKLSQMRPNVVFDAGLSMYSNTGSVVAARQALINKGWTITDGGSSP